MTEWCLWHKPLIRIERFYNTAFLCVGMIAATGFNVYCHFLQHLIFWLIFWLVFIIASGLGLQFLGNTSLLVQCERLMSLWKHFRKWKWTGQHRQAVRARLIQAVSFFDLLIVKFVSFCCACLCVYFNYCVQNFQINFKKNILNKSKCFEHFCDT